MRKLLLTQSQVAVVASSGAFILFAFLLFVSGLALQQKTVRDLHISIKPRLPQPPAALLHQREQSEIAERLLRSRYVHRNGDRVALTDLSRDIHEANTQVDWQRLAHVQLVQDHGEVCNAIMILAELQRMKSPARKVLLFPVGWAEEKRASKGEISDPFLDSTRRLMRMAARRYHIELRPIVPQKTAIPSDGSGTASTNEIYSLANIYALHGEFDRVLTIESPGLVVDAEPLDAILAFTEDTPFTMLHDTVNDDGVHSEDMFLLSPSEQVYGELSALISNSSLKDSKAASAPEFLAKAFPHPLLLESSTADSALVRAIGALHAAGDDFNQTAYMSNVAYLRFWDPQLPGGPQFDFPWDTKRAARPKSARADWTWTSLYARFAQTRRDVCGLDLETWRDE
jgi:hypothetical protein